MKIKTSELEGAGLNYCVDYIVTGKWPDTCDDGHVHAPDYQSDWSQGGPLIARHRVMIEPLIRIHRPEGGWHAGFKDRIGVCHGPTPLIAACRAIVAANLGDEVDVPEELTNE